MKKLSFLILLLLIVKSAWTQNTNLEYSKAVKVYNLTTYDEFDKSRKISTNPSYTQTNSSILQILHPTIAFQWKTKKSNFNEVELTSFILNKDESQTEIINDTNSVGQIVNGFDLITTNISLRYEYILNFNKQKETKIVPSLGFGVLPYFRKYNSKPIVSYLFPSSEMYVGSKFLITPRLTYYMSPKFFLDINIPICLFDLYYQQDKDEYPAIPVEERSISTFNFEVFPRIFSFRIGIGLKI